MQIHDHCATVRLPRRQFLGMLGALGITAGLPALGQQDRPITLILPLSPGSGVDTIMRSATQAWSHAAGHTVVVDNKPGAGGIVGTSALVRSTPDGYTLAAVSNNHVIFPSVYKSVPFDPIKDVTPITVIGSTPLLLVVNPQRLPAKNVEELVALLKAKPGAYNYASSGNGTILHLAAEMFNHLAGVQARHIPYKGSGPMTTALLSGEVDYGVLSLPPTLPHLKSGALHAIGNGGTSRIPSLPELPTIAEQGLAGYEMEGWFAAIAPAGLPKDKVDATYQNLKDAFNDPKVKESMDAQGNIIKLVPPADTAAYFESELKKYALVVKQAGIQRM